MSAKKNKKKKPIVIKTSACRKIKRSDGLKMKWVQPFWKLEGIFDFR